MSISRRAIITTTERGWARGRAGGVVCGMFSSVISAIENCGVIAHSNDSLINGGAPPPPPLPLWVTQWGRRARDGTGPREEVGGEKSVTHPEGRRRRRSLKKK